MSLFGPSHVPILRQIIHALQRMHDIDIIYFILFIYLFAHKTLHTYCHVQREQDNKAQITGTNSCPLSLNHTATDTNTMQCN